jgi:putative ABC transport system permease protein
VYLAVEGLLNVERYVAPLGSSEFVSIDESQWPAEEELVVAELHEACDGVAAVELEGERAWCTWEHGLFRWNTTSLAIESLRLPVLSDAPGFGRYPQMVLAFGGDNASLSVEEGSILTSQRLAALGLEAGELPMFVKGILPYAYGNDSALALRSEGPYAALPGFEQLADLDGVVLGLVNLKDAELLALAGDDDRSILMFSGPSFAEGNTTASERLRAWFDEKSTAEDLHLQTAAVQLDAAEQAEASSGLLSAMFLVFGSFTIAAGVLLSLTIIMLLADVRRKELATARALGMKRSDARAMFVLEGTAIALVSGGLGSLLGLGLAWLISVGFTSIFHSVGAQSFAFAWTLNSFFAGWIWGALLSMLLLSLSAAYNAQLNIVRALKDGRAPVKIGVPWGVFLAQITGLGGLGLCLIGLALFGVESGLSYAAYVGAGVGLILLVTPVITWQLPTMVARGNTTRWTRYAPRNTLGAIGVLFLIWTLVLAPIDPFRQRMEPNELAFIVLGLLQVLSGVMVLTSWAPMLVAALSKRRLFGGGPVRAVALAHPLAHPVRTAVVMGMFSITMFSVVVLAGYTEQFDTYSSDFVEEAEGEFELLLTSSRSRPISLDENPSAWGLNDSIIGNIDAVGAVYRAPIHLQDEEGERMPYLLRGVDQGFVAHGGLPLHIWDEALGTTSEEAWISIEQFNDVVFLDASFGLESTTDGSTLVPLQFSIGDSILLIDFSNPQNTREVRVGGFLKQSSYIFSPGVWMHASVVEEQFNGELTRMYVSVSPDAVPVTEAFAKAAVAAQGKSIGERRAAAELEDLLDRELASLNINVQTVADEIMVLQSLVLAILSLFEGYLALGLVVGVAGIGVVTVRNVSERRRTVGMLRAIGFRQRHVWRLFSIEVSWVAVLGMLNGLAIGYGFHVVLYTALWKSEGVAFSFPWASTLMVFLMGWVVVLVTTYVPVRQASQIPPSAALRSG